MCARNYDEGAQKLTINLQVAGISAGERGVNRSARRTDLALKQNPKIKINA